MKLQEQQTEPNGDRAKPHFVAGRTRLCAIARKGYGIVATELIASGEIIEENPCIVLDEADSDAVRTTRLRHYVYFWGEGPHADEAALAMGNLSFCNHSARPNAVIEIDKERRLVALRAARTIEVGTEITIDYDYPLDFAVEE